MVVAFTGSIDLFSVSQIRRALLEDLSDQPFALICDLAGVDTLDLVCATVFSTVANHPASSWPVTSFLLCGAQPPVAEILDRLQVPPFLHMYAGLEEALDAAMARLELRNDCLISPGGTAVPGSCAWSPPTGKARAGVGCGWSSSSPAPGCQPPSRWRQGRVVRPQLGQPPGLGGPLLKASQGHPQGRLQGLALLGEQAFRRPGVAEAAAIPLQPAVRALIPVAGRWRTTNTPRGGRRAARRPGRSALPHRRRRRRRPRCRRRA